MPLFRRQAADENVRKHAEKQPRPGESTARLQALLADTAERSQIRKHERHAAPHEEVKVLAPYLAESRIAYLVKFKQGEQIFTDYLAVSPSQLLIVTGVGTSQPDVEVVPFRGVTSIAGCTGHITIGIDGKQRDLGYIEPPEQATEIIAYVSARL